MSMYHGIVNLVNTFKSLYFLEEFVIVCSLNVDAVVGVPLYTNSLLK